MTKVIVQLLLLKTIEKNLINKLSLIVRTKNCIFMTYTHIYTVSNCFMEEKHPKIQERK